MEAIPSPSSQGAGTRWAPHRPKKDSSAEASAHTRVSEERAKTENYSIMLGMVTQGGRRKSGLSGAGIKVGTRVDGSQSPAPGQDRCSKRDGEKWAGEDSPRDAGAAPQNSQHLASAHSARHSALHRPTHRDIVPHTEIETHAPHNSQHLASRVRVCVCARTCVCVCVCVREGGLSLSLSLSLSLLKLIF
jgi:hypothetical protein